MSQPPTLSQSPPSRWPPVALVLLVFLAFLPAIFGEFTWDDDQWLLNNHAVQSASGLRAIWNPAHQDLHYYPLIFTMYWLAHQFWGLAPLGYHLLNTALHAVAAVLLYRILRRLRLRAAFLAAAVWAI